MRPLLLTLALTACAKAAPVAAAPETPELDPLAAVVLAPLPLWTATYADSPEAQGEYLRISAVMGRYGLSRLDAVEVQNHYRDLRRATPDGDRPAQLAEAVERVRSGDRESGLDPDEVAAARFIVVFDADETLYDQYYDARLMPECHAYAVRDGGGGMAVRFIRTAPKWTEAFEAVRDAGGKIAVFSANVDRTTLENFAGWMWEGVPLIEHPDVLGILTNSHLVLQSKTEGEVKAPVVEPSKDLRIFDETLAKVVLVDDNPWRTFQPAHLKLTAKFEADTWCDPDADPAAKAAVEGQLVSVADAVRDAAAWLDAHPDATFAQAFLPFTWLGGVAVDALAEGNGWSWPDAMDWLRAHPAALQDDF